MQREESDYYVLQTHSLHISVCVYIHLQEYLKQFNELFGELQAKKVGVMAVCAQPQDKVDEMMKAHELKFKVSSINCLSEACPRGPGIPCQEHLWTRLPLVDEILFFSKIHIMS